VRFVGLAYRAHDPRWSWSPLSGKGAGINGGRFNPKGVATFYLSLDSTTAYLEASQGFASRLVPPITMVTYEVDCDDIADLSTLDGLRAHRTSNDALACSWLRLAATGAPVPSWLLAQRLRGEGFAGIIVPSFAPKAGTAAHNLVLWRWGPALPHKVTTYDPDGRLPRDDSSWRVLPKP
jgi:RES domain-containing protein